MTTPPVELIERYAQLSAEYAELLAYVETLEKSALALANAADSPIPFVARRRARRLRVFIGLSRHFQGREE